MKKFTSLLALLGAGIMSAQAGTFTVSTDQDTHVYAIKNAYTNISNYYCSVNGNYVGSTTNKGNVAFYKIESSGTEGQYYIYCVSNSKYLTYSTVEAGNSKVTYTDSRDAAKQWKIKAESEGGETYDIYPADVTGNSGDQSWNWHGGVGYNLGFYASNDGACSWTFVEATNAQATITYKYGENTLATKTQYVIPGAATSVLPDAGVNYTRIGSAEPSEITSTTTNITVTLNEDLPFTKSKSYDEATWYVIDMHSNDAGLGNNNYVWTCGDNNTSITLPKNDMRQTNISDANLWCFVGDVEKGFKIYNKKAGANKMLRKGSTGNTSCEMSETDDHNAFKLYPSTVINGAVCFKLDDDTYYVNTQVNNSGVKELKGWTDADGGSSCRFFKPNYFVTNYASSMLSNYKMLGDKGITNALGVNEYASANYSAINSANETAKADGATNEQINTLASYNKNIIESATSASTVENGKCYRLLNASSGKYMTFNIAGSTLTTNATDNNKAATSVVKFVNSNTEGQTYYYMQVEGLNIAKYVRDNATITLVADNDANIGKYAVANDGPLFTFKDMVSNANHSYLHINGNNLVGWEASKPSQWYVIPATEVEVALSTVSGQTDKYASVYFPFAATVSEGTKAYVGALNSDNSRIDMTEVTTIPAGEGAVLVGTADKVTLTIANEATASTSNVLSGNNVRTLLTNDNRSNYLVFGVNEGNVGFYKPATSLSEIPNNKAFINATALKGIEALALNFGTVTAISNAAVESNANAPIYDLTGRKVANAVKGGIYIQNGKKFVK